MAEPTIEEMTRDLQLADQLGDSALAHHIMKQIQIREQRDRNLADPGLENQKADERRNTAFVKELGPVEGPLMAFGEAAKHTLKKAAAKAVGLLGGENAPELEAQNFEAERELAPLMREHPIAAGLGGAAITMPPAVVAGGPSLLGQAAAAAGVGGLVSDPGEGVKDALMSGGTALAGGALLKSLGYLGRTGLGRANRTSLRIMEPDAGTVMRQELEHGSYEKAGQIIHDLGLDKPGMDLRTRRDLLRQLGETAGVDINAALTEAERLGAKIDVPAMLKRMEALKKPLVGQPGQSNLTSSLRQAEGEISGQLDSLGAQPEVATGSPIAVEGAKRALQGEAYLTGARRYPNLSESRSDPYIAWLKRASGVAKESVEDAIRSAGYGTDDLAKFLKAKKVSGTAQAFEEPLSRAAATELATSSGSPLPGTVWSAKSGVTHALLDPVLKKVAPYWQIANRATGTAAQYTPQRTTDLLTQALVEALRAKQSQPPPPLLPQEE